MVRTCVVFPPGRDVRLTDSPRHEMLDSRIGLRFPAPQQRHAMSGEEVAMKFPIFHPFVDGIFPYKPIHFWVSPFMETPTYIYIYDLKMVMTWEW